MLQDASSKHSLHKCTCLCRNSVELENQDFYVPCVSGRDEFGRYSSCQTLPSRTLLAKLSWPPFRTRNNNGLSTERVEEISTSISGSCCLVVFFTSSLDSRIERLRALNTSVFGESCRVMHFRSPLVLVLVCSLPNVAPSAPCRLALKVDIEAVMSETSSFPLRVT